MRRRLAIFCQGTLNSQLVHCFMKPKTWSTSPDSERITHTIKNGHFRLTSEYFNTLDTLYLPNSNVTCTIFVERFDSNLIFPAAEMVVSKRIFKEPYFTKHFDEQSRIVIGIRNKEIIPRSIGFISRRKLWKTTERT